MKQFFLIIICFCTAAAANAQEEFNGPFPGWVNVKTRFGVKGNGKDDDTRALQLAIDSLTQPVINYNTGKAAYMVIYLPAGVYNISATLVLKGKIGVSIIGESPLTTTIKWVGANGGKMFLANGSAYIKVSRLTWDANGHKEIEAFGLHWKDRESDAKGQSAAAVNIEISDNIFTGACRFGISAGTTPGDGTNHMDSEISIRRCVFNNCTEAGIYIKGYNALDYWVWDCRFLACKDAISSTYGNYHVYRSYFKGSQYADMHNTNGYYISARGCYSEGSAMFSHDEGASSNPFKRIFQANSVVNSGTTPIGYYHLGKITALDNTFGIAKDTAVHAFIETGTWAPGNSEVLSLNNTYGYKTAVRFISGTNRLYSIKDNFSKAFKSSGAAAFISNQEQTPAKMNRTIIAVPAGAGSKKIQELIGQAMKLTGKRPVLYFPVGRYILDEPLLVPANADMQLIGEGYLYASVIMPSAAFPKGKALLNIKGPTNIVIRDLQLNQFTNNMSGIDGIRFTNVDQPGSRAFVEQLYTNSPRSLHGDGLDYLSIQESNSFYSVGKTITGGPLVQQGKGEAALNCFGGQYAGLSTGANAKAVMKDCWWEGAIRKPLDFSGSGNITIDGVMVAPTAADSNTTISINRFSGKISLLNIYVQGGLQVEKNNPGLSLLLWNIHFYHTLDPLKSITPQVNYKAAFMGLTTQCFTAGDKKCDNIFTVPDVFKGGVKTDTFLPEMLSDDRAALPVKYTAGLAGASSIFISRISAGDCNTTISFAK
jgi:hypothetical protein